MRDPQTVVAIPADTLLKPQRIAFEGTEFNAPANMKAYLKTHYGAPWKAKTAETPKSSNRAYCISYDDLPYEDALAIMAESGIDYRAVQERAYQQFMFVSCEVRRLQGAAFSEFCLAEMSRMRIDDFVAMEPHRAKLRAVAAAGEVETLSVLLKDYMTHAEGLFDEWHIGLYLDEEVTAAAKQVWAARGKSSYADALLAAVPPAIKRRNLRSALQEYL